MNEQKKTLMEVVLCQDCEWFAKIDEEKKLGVCDLRHDYLKFDDYCSWSRFTAKKEEE